MHSNEGKEPATGRRTTSWSLRFDGASPGPASAHAENRAGNRARSRVFITDNAPARIGSLSRIDTFYTDRPLPGDLATRCRDWGVQVDIADRD